MPRKPITRSMTLLKHGSIARCSWLVFPPSCTTHATVFLLFISNPIYLSMMACRVRCYCGFGKTSTHCNQLTRLQLHSVFQPMIMRISLILRIFYLLTACLFFMPGNACSRELPRLRVSDNQRFLLKEDGAPLVWIGDTLWDWYKLTPSQLDEYLDVRAFQGYTVVQTQIAAYGRANYLGHWCFGGPAHKDITQPVEAWFRYGDVWLDKIEKHGMYAAVGLSWIITHWSIHDKAGDPVTRFSEEDFYNYGKWVGNRYRERNNVIWLSLNESTYPTTPVNKVKAVCRGIRHGDTSNKPLTLHPLAGSRSTELFGDALDFNSWQTARFLSPANLPFGRRIPRVDDKVSGEYVKGTFTVWEAIADDYNRTPAKPVIDLEAWYEGHLDDMPVLSTNTRATAWHCRRRAYFVILAGSFGHTYGAQGLAYQIKGDSWKQGLYLPGGEDMGHIAQLLGSPKRPLLKMAPDQSLITAGQSDSYDSHKQAARACDGSYAYVYSADGSDFALDLTKLGRDGDNIVAQWFDPREGVYHSMAKNPQRIFNQAFDPPGTPAPDNDWVLVLCTSSMN